MDNKLSELSKPVAWSDERRNLCTNTIKERGLDSKYRQDYEKYSTPIYSQEYVSALIQRAERLDSMLTESVQALKAAEQRIAELERANTSQDDHINQQQDRIDSLEKTNTGLGRRIGDAEKRLATPVQLQNCDFESVAIMAHWCTDEQLKAWVKGVEHAKKQIRAAGFTVSEE